MKKIIVLIGEKESKRFTFLNKAIDKNVYSFICMSWNEIDTDMLRRAYIVKIDTPTIEYTSVEYLTNFIEWYRGMLNKLSLVKDVKYLNKPQAIIDSLDKVYVKKVLKEKGVMSTETLGYNIKNYNEFKELLFSKKMKEAFIKPIFGSGACGIIVYRSNPKNGEEIIYTTMALGDNGELMNCKSINKINNKERIKILIDEICKVGVIVEKWEKKDGYKDHKYDLRVVYQFGKIDYIVARGSLGPITNLHLNNKPIDIKNLNFTKEEIKKIERLCAETVACFDGLNVAGIDILVTPDRDFKIIEVNSQGDLIYADINNENNIYKNQVLNFEVVGNS